MIPNNYTHTPVKFSGRFTDAAKQGDLTTVKSFIEQHGRDVNHASRWSGDTALIQAAKHGQTNVIKYLLQQPGIEVNKRNGGFTGSNALGMAVGRGNIPDTLLLTQKGADITGGRFRSSAAKSARKQGLHNLACCLEDLEQGQSPLALAARYGAEQTVIDLLDLRANPNGCNQDFEPPIHTTARSGMLKALQSLITQKAQINKQAPGGQTAILKTVQSPLLTGAQKKHVLEILINNGGNVHQSAENGDTPLIAAVKRKDGPTAQLLLELQADPRIKNLQSDTALSIAKRNKFPALIKKLENAMKLSNQRKSLNLDPAAERQHQKERLEKSKKIYELIAQNNIYDFDEMRKEEWDPNWTDEKGYKSLNLATVLNHHEIVGKILEHAPDVNARDVQGKSALHWLAYFGHNDLCSKMLQRHHPDLDPQDRNGTTPLMMAAQKGHKDVVLNLLSNSANKTIKDYKGKNAADYAKAAQHEEISELLKI